MKKNKNLEAKGPIGKFLTNKALEALSIVSEAKPGDSIFFACGKLKEVEKLLSQARDKIGEDLNLIDQNIFEFCWIVDYPMFEIDENTNKIKFSHNPFSMPKGDINQLNFNKPLEIIANQYDIVCNGIELSSGAIRNHLPNLMYKLFSIAGYTSEQVDIKFSGMINA